MARKNTAAATMWVHYSKCNEAFEAVRYDRSVSTERKDALMTKAYEAYDQALALDGQEVVNFVAEYFDKVDANTYITHWGTEVKTTDIGRCRDALLTVWLAERE